MKICPNCGELLGDSVKECFKCHCNYAYEAQKKEEAKREQLSKNQLFEYKVIIIEDLPSGEVDNMKIQRTLDEWSEKGWRLHSIYSSEIGKNAIAVVNATINQTVMIFERCIKG